MSVADFTKNEEIKIPAALFSVKTLHKLGTHSWKKLKDEEYEKHR